MDQKHAMLYPSVDPGHEQRFTAAAAIGLPTEAPPSYDMAMAIEPSTSRAGAPPSTAGGWAQPSAPQFSVQPQPLMRNEATTRSVIVEQPVQQPQLPTNLLPQQQHNLPYQHPQHLPNVLPTATSPIPAKLGPNPCAVTCPACGTCKTTRMCYTPNSRTHMCALLLCLVGWCCCACCVPYCMNSCRTGNHYCSKCNTFLGAFNPRERR